MITTQPLSALTMLLFRHTRRREFIAARWRSSPTSSGVASDIEPFQVSLEPVLALSGESARLCRPYRQVTRNDICRPSGRPAPFPRLRQTCYFAATIAVTSTSTIISGNASAPTPIKVLVGKVTSPQVSLTH